MFRTTFTLTAAVLSLSTLASAGDFKFQIMPKLNKPKVINQVQVVPQQSHVQPMLIDPGFNDHHDDHVRPAPSLGFRGHFDAGEGMHVERVLCGSFAEQLGLESGDLIVRINNTRLHCEHDYFDALGSAHTVRLLVRDVNSGRLVWTRSVCIRHFDDAPVFSHNH